MKHSMVAGPIILWLWFPALAIAAGFEGVITVKETSEGSVESRNFYFKGEKMRVNDGDAGFSVWDAGKKEGFFVDLEGKTYSVMNWSDMNLQDAKTYLANIALKKTGKSEKVAGYACEGYLAKDKSDGSTSELCIAKGLSNNALFGILAGDGSARGGYPPWFRDLIKDGGFPLRQLDRDPEGNEESRSETTKIEAKRLDDGLFLPPAGFRKTELGK